MYIFIRNGAWCPEARHFWKSKENTNDQAKTIYISERASDSSDFPFLITHIFPSNTMSSLASPPSLWISFWMFLTTLIVSWGKSCKIVPSRRPSLTPPLDAGYCLMRPRSLSGGDLSWIWKPYKWVYYLLWCNELTWISDFPYGEVSSAVQV